MTHPVQHNGGNAHQRRKALHSSRASQSAQFLDAIWANREGWACIAHTDGPKGGKFGEELFWWPAQRGKLLAYIEKRAPLGNVYLAPCLFKTREVEGEDEKPRTGRQHDNALPPRWLWVDLDGSDPNKLWIDRLHPVIVESGTPGHLQLWVPLAEGVDPDRARELNRRLVQVFEADRHPVSGAALMRVPGTQNFNNQPPRPALVQSPPNGFTGLGPADLDALLPAPDRGPGEGMGQIPDEIYEGEGRNTWMTSLAGSDRRRGLTADEIFDRLMPLNEARCHPPLEQDELRTISRSVGRYEPGDVPRTEQEQADELAAETQRELLRLEARDHARREVERRKYPFASALADKRFAAGADLLVMYDRAKAQRPTFLVEGVVKERSYGALGAEYKAGKTWLLLDMLVSLAAGGPWLGHFPIPARRRVAYMLGEGQEDEFVRRFDAICALKAVDPRELLQDRISVQVGSSNLSDPDQIERIHRDLSAFKPDLIVVDPWYLSAGEADGKNIVVAAKVLDNLAGMARHLGSALLIAQHWNKTGQGNGTGRWTGSGLQEWSRFMVNVEVKGSADAAPYAHDPTGRTEVTLRVGLSGEVSGKFQVERAVWTDDARRADSDMHYTVSCTELGGTEDEAAPRSVEDHILDVIFQATRQGEQLTKTEICSRVAGAKPGRKFQETSEAFARLTTGQEPRVVAGPPRAGQDSAGRRRNTATWVCAHRPTTGEEA